VWTARRPREHGSYHPRRGPTQRRGRGVMRRSLRSSHRRAESAPWYQRGMKRTAIRTDAARAAIGPYSQAVRVGELLFTSGQIPLDPATGAIVPGDIVAQTRRVLDNLEAVLAAGGATWADVAKATIYLHD